MHVSVRYYGLYNHFPVTDTGWGHDLGDACCWLTGALWSTAVGSWQLFSQNLPFSGAGECTIRHVTLLALLSKILHITVNNFWLIAVKRLSRPSYAAVRHLEETHSKGDLFSGSNANQRKRNWTIGFYFIFYSILYSFALWLTIFWNEVKHGFAESLWQEARDGNFSLISSLQWAHMVKKERNQIPISGLQTQSHGWSSAPPIAHLFKPVKAQTRNQPILCRPGCSPPPRYVGCTPLDFQWEKHSRYRYVAPRALQAVNFGMGVYSNTLHLLDSFINCRRAGLLLGFTGSYGKMTITE